MNQAGLTLTKSSTAR